jgi:hypothetical protein
MYGILFIAGFAFLAPCRPADRRFEGGLVVGYLLWVWETMSISSGSNPGISTVRTNSSSPSYSS